MKKRSRRRHKNPARLTFFLDANVDGDLAAETIRQLGHNVVRCREVYPGKVDDVDIIPPVAREGWIYISKDLAVYTDKDERKILRESQVRGFLFGRGDLTKKEISSILCVAVPRIARLLKTKGRRGRGLLRRITPKGDLASL